MMKQWLAGCLGATILLGGLVGCAKQCFLSKEDFDRMPHLIPAGLETDPQAGVLPITGSVPTPPDVDAPDRPPRFISLQECIALALEHGIAPRGGAGSGQVDDTLVSFQNSGGLNNQSSAIRVLALNPAIAQTAIEQSLSRFDAQWITSMNWTQTDNLQQGLSSFQNGSRAAFQSTVVKPLASGGIANVSFQTDYTLLQAPPAGAFGVINPNYTTRMTFGFEQPLIQNFGTDINQLLNRLAPISGITMPNQAAAGFNQRQQVLTQPPSFTVNPTEGILVARLRYDASRAEFERNMQNMLLDVEIAYWRLYQAYGRLYSFEEVLRIAHKSWMINDAKFKAGTIGPANFHPIRGQYEEFRGERVAALGLVLEAERNLRGLIGLPVEDGTRLVPISPPTLAPYRPDFEVCLQDALTLKPELVLARDNLRGLQYNLEVQKNFLKPDLRFVAQYSPVGFGTRLDGTGNFIDGAGSPRPSNAFRSLSSNHFDDWTVGLTLNMPLGFRLEHASVRSGRLALAQGYYLLKDQEERVKRTLTQQYQKLAEWHKLIETRRAEREAYARSVEARFREFTAGKTTVADFLLEAQRRLATAQVKEYEAISEYNNTLARLEWAKGSLLTHNNVQVAEGPLPSCAQVRAVENERARSRALVLRERPAPLTHPGRLAGEFPELPEMPAEPRTPEETAPAPRPAASATGQARSSVTVPGATVPGPGVRAGDEAARTKGAVPAEETPALLPKADPVLPLASDDLRPAGSGSVTEKAPAPTTAPGGAIPGDKAGDEASRTPATAMPARTKGAVPPEQTTGLLPKADPVLAPPSAGPGPAGPTAPAKELDAAGLPLPGPAPTQTVVPAGALPAPVLPGPPPVPSSTVSQPPALPTGPSLELPRLPMLPVSEPPAGPGPGVEPPPWPR